MYLPKRVWKIDNLRDFIDIFYENFKKVKLVNYAEKQIKELNILEEKVNEEQYNEEQIIRINNDDKK